MSIVFYSEPSASKIFSLFNLPSSSSSRTKKIPSSSPIKPIKQLLILIHNFNFLSFIHSPTFPPSLSFSKQSNKNFQIPFPCFFASGFFFPFLSLWVFQLKSLPPRSPAGSENVITKKLTTHHRRKPQFTNCFSLCR